MSTPSWWVSLLHEPRCDTDWEPTLIYRENSRLKKFRVEHKSMQAFQSRITLPQVRVTSEGRVEDKTAFPLVLVGLKQQFHVCLLWPVLVIPSHLSQSYIHKYLFCFLDPEILYLGGHLVSEDRLLILPGEGIRRRRSSWTPDSWTESLWVGCSTMGLGKR